MEGGLMPDIRCTAAKSVAHVRFGSEATDIGVGPRHVRFTPKADISSSRLLLCNLAPEPHSAGRKTLL
jgi:hypothetical protein